MNSYQHPILPMPNYFVIILKWQDSMFQINSYSVWTEQQQNEKNWIFLITNMFKISFKQAQNVTLCSTAIVNNSL